MNGTMMTGGIAIPDGMILQNLPAEDGNIEFWGTFLDSEESGSEHDSRWTELSLYKMIDTDSGHDSSLPSSDDNRNMFGQQMWLLHTVAHSVVYHGKNGCGRGVRMRVADFGSRLADPEVLERCERCDPEVWWESSPDAEFRVEVPLYFYTACQTPQKVIRSLWREPRCENCHDRAHEDGKCRKCGCTQFREAKRTLSIPGRNLLERVAQKDPEIAAAMSVTKRL